MDQANNQNQQGQNAPVNATSGNENKIAILCYIGILVIIPLLTNKNKEEFVRFHTRQGLVLLIIEIIASIGDWMPFFGWIFGLICFACFILSIIGIVNVLNGKTKQLPIVGKYADQINI